ncbi:MAG: PAS domain-containing protein [Acidimicrobiia bacterium]
MEDKNLSSITRAILHALPTSILVLDSNDNIIVANIAASKILGIPKEYLEGGNISRYTPNNEIITSVPKQINFVTNSHNLQLLAASKEIVSNDEIFKVILLKNVTSTNENLIVNAVTTLSNTNDDPFVHVCKSLVSLEIAKYACIRNMSTTQCEIIASSTDNNEVFNRFPTIEKNISSLDGTNYELVLIPDSHHGLTPNALSTIEMFISLLNLRFDTQENATDASGSETALSLALKAGDMGMCFFDSATGDAYISDRLATWCGINNETFNGTINSWLETFRQDDKERVKELFSELDKHNKFKTIVNIHTLEQDLRLELTGRPLHDKTTTQWVAIAKQYRDEQEVEAAWKTRIAMEESARLDAEESLEDFEKKLFETLIPTTSDVNIIHSRQDAGTWHVVRQLNSSSYIYAVGSATATSRNQAIINSVLVSTIADVLSSGTESIEQYVDLIRDHARARDIETTIAAVKVVNGQISAATHGGASVFISGKPLIGEFSIQTTTALSLSSHSQATQESIEVASNGQPWRILSTVIEVVSIVDAENFIENEEVDLGNITGQIAKQTFNKTPSNVSQFRSGSINPQG